MTKYSAIITASLAAVLAIFALAPLARGDIFQWEYINPANPGQGKQPSTMLCPDGAGANAVPAANLSYRNLAMAYLTGADLSEVSVWDDEGGLVSRIGANLTAVSLSQADLTNANLGGAKLTAADFTNAEVRGTNLGATAITAAQIYSTASYKAHDLTGIGLTYNDLTGGVFTSQNLTSAQFYLASLANANLSQANLTNANFWYATLTGTNLTGAEVRGADFTRNDDYYPGTGITLAQLYSTASYQAEDLTRIGLQGNDLTGANLVGQNLTDANFTIATLTGANLAGADIRGANFQRDVTYNLGSGIALGQLYATASYQAHDLTGIGLQGNDLTGANLVGQNLTDASFYAANLTGANLTGAEVRGMDFSHSSIMASQLYSTASYLAHDLTRIKLEFIDLAGVNLAGQNLTSTRWGGATLTNANFNQANLTNADFSYGSADLTGANLSQANLSNANFSYAALTNANLNGADVRGANFQYATLSGANTSNLVQSNGHIAGLDLTSGASLVVHDYDGNPSAYPTPTGPLPIVVDQHLAMNATGTLRLIFDADPWDSLISFAPGIPVALGGTLDLTFADGVSLNSQLGRTIDLFDWTGVTPTGAFTVSSPYTWNLTKLYTTGEVTLTALAAIPGDYNLNGVVDAADYVVWRKTLGQTGTGLTADGDGNHEIGVGDYDVWRAHFGQPPGSGAGDGVNAAIPEPATLALLIVGLLSMFTCRRAAVS